MTSTSKSATPAPTPRSDLRSRLHDIIFEADTPAGRAFDVVLIVCILLSVLAVMLDSVRSVRVHLGGVLHAIEWTFTILFSIEYIVRLYCTGRPWMYARSFYGVVDLFAIFPTYLGLFFPGTHYLLTIRILRVLRIFRVLKLVQYVGESAVLVRALLASRRKITIFIFCVLAVVTIIGSLMYIIEGERNGFTSIPQSIYWAIVTVTTVGYGDMVPQTLIGRLLAMCLMLLGYGIIAVPTGIVSVELAHATRQGVSNKACSECSAEGHDPDAGYCKHCGTQL